MAWGARNLISTQRNALSGGSTSVVMWAACKTTNPPRTAAADSCAADTSQAAGKRPSCHAGGFFVLVALTPHVRARREAKAGAERPTSCGRRDLGALPPKSAAIQSFANA